MRGFGQVAPILGLGAASVIAAETAELDLVRPGFAILALWVVGTAQLVWALRQHERRHAYDLSALHVFAISVYVFFVLSPTITFLTGRFFLIYPRELGGLVRAMCWGQVSSLAYCAAYLWMIGDSQRTAPVVAPRSDERQLAAVQAKIAALMLALGLVAVGYFVLNAPGALFDLSTPITHVLRGQLWIFSVTELLGVGGIALMLSGRRTGNRAYRIAGAAALITCTAVAVLTRGRYSSIRYLLAWAVAREIYQVSGRRPRKRIAAVYASIVIIAMISPMFGGARSGHFSWDAIAANYRQIATMDFNFIESVARLMAYDLGGSLGENGGLTAALAVVIPRALWEQKPEVLAIRATEVVIDDAGYALDVPTFGFALTYVGSAYVLWGFAGIIPLALVLGAACGAIVRWARPGTSGAFQAVAAGIGVVHLTFHVVKDDVFATWAHMMLPFTVAVLAAIVSSRFSGIAARGRRFRISMGGRPSQVAEAERLGR